MEVKESKESLMRTSVAIKIKVMQRLLREKLVIYNKADAKDLGFLHSAVCTRELAPEECTLGAEIWERNLRKIEAHWTKPKPWSGVVTKCPIGGIPLRLGVMIVLNTGAPTKMKIGMTTTMNNVSYSKYSTALACLRKYKYLYVDMLEQAPSKDMAFGTALHAGLNALLEGEDGLSVFDICWDSEKDVPGDYDRFSHEDLRKLGQSFMTKFEKYHLYKYSLVESEKRLFGSYAGIRFEGTPDAIVEYGGKLTLLDFKTTAYEYPKDKAVNALQMHLYCYLYQQNHGIWPEQVMYVPFVKTKGSIQTPLIAPITEEIVLASLNDMVQYLKKIGSSEEYPRNPNSCYYGKNRCQFYEQCWGKSKATD